MVMVLDSSRPACWAATSNLSLYICLVVVVFLFLFYAYSSTPSFAYLLSRAVGLRIQLVFTSVSYESRNNPGLYSKIPQLVSLPFIHPHRRGINIADNPPGNIDRQCSIAIMSKHTCGFTRHFAREERGPSLYSNMTSI